MTYNLSTIMRTAWANLRVTREHYERTTYTKWDAAQSRKFFINALKQAWAEAKKVARVLTPTEAVEVANLKAEREALTYSDAPGTAAKLSALTSKIAAYA